MRSHVNNHRDPTHPHCFQHQYVIDVDSLRRCAVPHYWHCVRACEFDIRVTIVKQRLQYCVDGTVACCDLSFIGQCQNLPVPQLRKLCASVVKLCVVGVWK